MLRKTFSSQKEVAIVLSNNSSYSSTNRTVQLQGAWLPYATDLGTWTWAGSEPS